MKSFFLKIIVYNYLIASTLFLFSACQQEEKESKKAKYNFKEYYFPVDDLYEGKVYAYQPVGKADSLGAYFWYYKINSGYLTGTKYNENLKIEQIVTEDIVRNGTMLHRLQLCNYLPNRPDFCEPIVPNIEAPAVFPFEMQDSTGVFLYKIRWNDPQDTTVENTIIRNRHFIGFQKRVWKEEAKDCAVFGIREEVVVGSKDEGYQRFRIFTEEFYAKNLGLIYYKKNIDNSVTWEYELQDTLQMMDLERLYKMKN